MAIQRPQKLFSYLKDQALDKDISQLYDWVSKLELVTTAPNGSKTGKKGEAVWYVNGSDYELWVNTDGSTTWQRIENKASLVELKVNGISYLGDGGTTNYIQIDATGNLVFVGGAGLAYGEIYTSDNSTETTIATQNVWVQCTVFDTNGESNNSTPDHTNDHITIDKAGKYLVIVSASVLSGAGSAFDGEFEVYKNNGATALTNIHTDRDLSGGGGDHGSISLSGIANLAVNDTVELWARNKTNTTNLTFEDVTLSIVQIGG